MQNKTGDSPTPIDRLTHIEFLLEKREYCDAKELVKEVSGSLSHDQILRLATAYKRLGDIKSQNHLLKILKEGNKLPVQSLADLAESEIFLGNIDSGREIYRSILDSNPNFQKVYFEYARLTTPDTDKNLEKEIRNQIKKLEGRTANTVFMHYALGKILEDKHDYSGAFDCYNKAGRQAKLNSKYTATTDIDLIHEVIASNTGSRQEANDTKINSHQPIFIVGLPRSGTTLIERFVSKYDGIQTINETYFLQIALCLDVGLEPKAVMDTASMKKALSADMRQTAYTYLNLTAHLRSGHRTFIEKFPENILYLDPIFHAFPNAKVIMASRNPLDNCLALFKQPYFRYAYSLDDLGAFYTAYNKLATHWGERYGSKIHVVQYEKLITDPHTATSDLAYYLDMPIPDKITNYFNSDSPSTSASSAQVRKSLHTNSIDLWKKYQEQLEPLFNSLHRNGVITESGDLKHRC